MTNTALITGASSGIGAELAKLHAERGGDVVIVARRVDKLNSLKVELEQRHGVTVTVLEANLEQAGAAERIFEMTQSAGIQVDILINNAGFGGHGKFHQRELTKDMAMIQVNVVALVELTHLYLQDMVRRNSGRILHVASSAAFMPGPLMAVYYASKSFVASFSQAIAQELAGTNITSTVLCPGPVATGFVEASDLAGVPTVENAASPRSVAECGYRAMMRGDLVKINNPMIAFFLNWIIPLLPRRWVLKLGQSSMKKRGT